ncbi:MAG: 3-dehydroquinate synthase [Phycisphaerae bacterium]|nr:3-dehydroquinate synthase [Phycisphaerae bacterium]
MTYKDNSMDSKQSNTISNQNVEQPGIEAFFSLECRHRLFFTEDVFNSENSLLPDLLEPTSDKRAKVAIFIDSGVVNTNSGIIDRINAFIRAHTGLIELAGDVQVVPGSEEIKNAHRNVELILKDINNFGLCRKSYVIVIGGGAVLDAVGFAAAMAHRGIRLIRITSTTMSQCDSGMGVKNGINAFEKKNFLGFFAVPWAVINDESLLRSLNDRDWMQGFSEIVKVALLKDSELFDKIAGNASKVRGRDLKAAIPLIRASARLHFEHITLNGDPFELLNARPLDFGHWSAHKLEQMTHFELGHGEAVAIGMAIDITYANLMGWLSNADHQRIINTLRQLGFKLFHPVMEHTSYILKGLDEFREHLGGNLAIPMIRTIGGTFDVHEIDNNQMRNAITYLADLPD